MTWHDQLLATTKDNVDRWLDGAATWITSMISRLSKRPVVMLMEGPNGELLLSPDVQPTDAAVAAEQSDNTPRPGFDPGTTLKDRDVEVVLRSEQFLYRCIDVPAGAADFLGGIIRSQLERLMPWNYAEMAYGWSTPTPSADGRLNVTVAGTSHERITPLLRAVADAGVRSTRLFVLPPEPGANPIPLLAETGSSTVTKERIRRALSWTFIASVVSCLLMAVLWIAVGLPLRDEQTYLLQEIKQLRAANGHWGPLDARSESAALTRRNLAPYAVLVLEELAKLLPDRTYIKELRIEGDKLYISGYSDDAVSLIGLLEKSRHFSKVTFFAPTTKLANGLTGESFHIEAFIRTPWLARTP
jgi:general secretion pathway protein L